MTVLCIIELPADISCVHLKLDGLPLTAERDATRMNESKMVERNLRERVILSLFNHIRIECERQRVIFAVSSFLCVLYSSEG
mmetsp:Transcript_35173/g.73663  ORF Transcript_35173/g.73663 Transcript_35173/m.73663 type:complete len:82 (-) Transcript_35173:451-696(-)